MALTLKQFSNGRQWRGRPPTEVDRAFREYLRRLQEVERPLEAVAASDDPREAINRLLPAVVRDLERWLALEARRAKPEPSVTSRLAECRQLISVANEYREASGPEELAQRIASEIVARLQAANFDETSPAEPIVTETEDDADQDDEESPGEPDPDDEEGQ